MWHTFEFVATMISWDLVLVLIYFSSTSYCREYHIASRYLNHLNDSENKYLIYPSFNQCTNADNLRLQVDFPGENKWSLILNQFLFYRFGEPDSYAEEMIFSNIFGDSPVAHILHITTYWVGLYFIMSVIGIVLLPFFGAICCFILAVVLYSLGITFKFLGRHTIITYERVRRRREKLILPRKHPHLRRKFVMPHVFRSYSDEETPKILERRTTDESSDSDSDEEERFIRELLENEAKLTQTTDSLTELPTIEAATVTETEEEKVQELDKPIQKKQTTEPVLKLTSAFSPKRNSPADSGTSGGASSGYTSGDETYNVEKKDEVRKPTPKFVSFGTQTPAEENLRSPASVSGLLRKSYHSRPKKAALKRKRNRTSHKLDPDANQTKAHDTFLKTRQDKTELSPTKRAGQISQLNIKANPMPLFPKVGQQPRLSPSTMTRKLATENIPVQKVTPGIKPAAKGRISSPATPAQFLTILPKGHPNSVRPQLSGTSYPRIPGTNATKTQLGKSQGRKLTPPGPSVGPTRLRPNPKTGWGKGSPRKSKRETEAGSGTTGSSDSPKPKSASSPNDILSNPNKKSQP